MKKYLTLKNLGWLLTVLVAVMLGMAAISKIIGTEEMIKNFTFMNLLPYIEFVGVLKLLAIVLLVIPRTSLYGAALVGSIMSAAVALHLSLMGGEGVVTPIVIGSMAWIGYFLRKK